MAKIYLVNKFLGTNFKLDLDFFLLSLYGCFGFLSGWNATQDYWKETANSFLKELFLLLEFSLDGKETGFAKKESKFNRNFPEISFPFWESVILSKRITHLLQGNNFPWGIPVSSLWDINRTFFKEFLWEGHRKRTWFFTWSLLE